MSHKIINRKEAAQIRQWIEAMDQNDPEARQACKVNLISVLCKFMPDLVPEPVLACARVYFGLADSEEAEEFHCRMRGAFGADWADAVAQVTSEFEEEPQPQQDDGWIEWRGGMCPVPGSTRVQVKFAGGGSYPEENPLRLNWAKRDRECDIIAYRVIENDGREG